MHLRFEAIFEKSLKIEILQMLQCDSVAVQAVYLGTHVKNLEKMPQIQLLRFCIC